MPTPLSVVSILVLVLAAGLVNPRLIWTAWLNIVVSIVGFLVFETYAVQAYYQYSATHKFFLSNMILALICLVATYFAVKTGRGMWLTKQH